MFYFCPKMIRYTNSIFTKSSSEKINELVKLHTDSEVRTKNIEDENEFFGFAKYSNYTNGGIYE